MSDLIDTFPGLNKFFLNTLWVSSRGDDENPGFFPGKPKRTFTAALAAASDASRNATRGAPSTTNRVSVICLDAGVYTESLVMPDNVDIFAPMATIIGNSATGPTISVGNGNRIDFFSIKANPDGTELFSSSAVLKAAAGFSFLSARHVYPVAAGVGLGSISSTGALHAHVGIIHVPANGIGCGGGLSGAFGHLHIYVGDIYFEGDNAIGVIAGSNAGTAANVVGFVEHMLETGGPHSNTIGFAALTDGETYGHIYMMGGYVTADTLVVVNAGSSVKVVLADGRVLGADSAPTLTGAETVTVEVDGVVYKLTLDDLKSWVTA